jgi:hypothetical protein
MADKEITIELTPEQYDQLLRLQPDTNRLPALAQELITQALRNGMAQIPGRKTRPVPERR